MILCLGFVIVTLAQQLSLAQTANVPRPPKIRNDFWSKTKAFVEKRKQSNQPMIQPQASNLDASRVCRAAHEELERRGITAGPSTISASGSRFTFPDRPVEEVAFSAVAAGRNSKPQAHNTTHQSTVNNGAVEISDSVQFAIDQVHSNCFDGTEFPSAAKCARCHPGHYEEWSVSPHAYAQLSPVFNAMSSKLNVLTNGTLGDFCIRCHTPVGMARNEPIVMSNLDRYPAAREGVTCVVCHRINQNWGKISGRQALVGGGLDNPVYGPFGNDTLEQVLANPDKYGVLKAGGDPNSKSKNLHRESVPFFALTTPATCASCHDVFAPNGFRLEDAFSEFKTSPAAREKQQNCQDCHMGVSPGVASGYAFEPAAKVGNAYTPPRLRTNHMMVGPDYSIVHPGLFPHNPKAVKEESWLGSDVELGLATMREWLSFDHVAGW